jgi:4,5-dihydroxyphthalate decarboxylase
VKESLVSKTKLFTLLGDHPNSLPLKTGEVRSDLVEFQFADVKVANNGFKPMVREAKFDLGELAIVTYLQAKAYNKPYVVMPATVVGRGQHHTIAYNPERGPLKPSDLAGKRVGVRAYTVTTGVWVRGILQEQYGVEPETVRWITFEDPHLAEFKDPPIVEKAPSGKTMADMLLAGELDAAIVGDKLPDPRLKLLIPDAEAASETWARSHGGTPINHMLVIRSELTRTRPDVVREVYRVFKDSWQVAVKSGNKRAGELQFGIEAARKPLETIIGFAYRQKLIPRAYAVEELFDDVTRGLT